MALYTIRIFHKSRILKNKNVCENGGDKVFKGLVVTGKMSSENEVEDKQKCNQTPCIPEEVRVKYFPQFANKFSYDVLPLFELEDYNKKTMKEVSILENPKYRDKWEAFKNGIPQTALALKPVYLVTNKVPIFSNYRRQKVPPEFLASFHVPPSPDALFRKTK
ncbi:hypothetical protein RUM43_008631 [Polyplax serrata]|uniref:Uncharacterized protein n=1 Tax=Polyplax serrata TaxID=468196 RepID=A0AAN8S1G5_POLSC